MGKSQGTQKVTQETRLPAWYETAAQNAIKSASTAASNLAQPYQGNTVAGLDPLQQQAISLTGQNVGATNQAYQAAQGGALGAMGYKPQNVNTGYNAMMLGADYTPQNVSSGTVNYGYQPERVGFGQQDYSYSPTNVSSGSQDYNFNPLEVSGGSFLTGDLSKYMNPYIDNVEQAALRNMTQGYQQGLNTLADRAIGAGAFGGSRQGVAEGTAAAEFARQYGDLSANLRSQAYNAASDLAGQDLSRNMQAQLANQQAGMGNAQFGANLGMQNIANNLAAQQFNATQGMNNAQFGANLGFQGQQQALQAALANQQAGMSNAQFGANIGMQNVDNNLQAALANQQAGLQGAQLNQQAQLANQDALYNQYAMSQQAALANQQAGLQGAQLNLQGSQSLGDMATAGQNAYLQSLQSALSAGQINQDQAQAMLDQQAQQYDAIRNYPLEQLNINLAALGGTQVPTSTVTKTPTTGNPFLQGLGAVGTVLGGLGSMGIISDERMKTNIEPIGIDGMTGLPIYAYDYKSDVMQSEMNGKPMPPKRVGPMAQDFPPEMLDQIGGHLIVRGLI